MLTSKHDEKINNSIDLDNMTDIYITKSYLDALLGTRIIEIERTRYDINAERLISTIEYVKEGQEIKKTDSEHLSQRTLKYNESMFKLSMLFWKRISPGHITMFFTSSELTRISGVCHVRTLLTTMKQIELITYNDTDEGIEITLNHVYNEKNKFKTEIKPYIYIPKYYLSDNFLKEPLAVQKMLLYMLKESCSFSEISETYNRATLMNFIGESNLTRFDSHMERVKEILNIDYKIKKTIYYYKGRKRARTFIKISIGKFENCHM